MIARQACADPDETAKRTAADLRKFGILNVALSVDCSLGPERGGQRWIYRASPGEQSVLIMRTPKGEMRWPILMARLTADKRLRIVIVSPNAGKPWEIILRQLSPGKYRPARPAPLDNKPVLGVEKGIYVETPRPPPPLQRCRE